MITAWILGISTILGGIAAVWFFIDKALKRLIKAIPELPVDIDMAEQLGLRQQIEAEGYRLFGGNVKQLQSYLQFGDYERIIWTDSSGKKYLITSPPGSDMILLKTRYSSEEINKRKEDRKRRPMLS